MSKRKYKKKMGLNRRIFYFLIGSIMASILLIFGFNWELLPFRITGLGYDITPFALSFIFVLIGIFASTLMKSGLIGKSELDM